MSDFSKFSKLVHAQFNLMSKGELFTIGLPDTVWETYLASFPEGTNPLYRERTEHDCSCCRQFIRGLGNVVSIVDGKIVTVWDVVGAESPYAEVAHALSEFVGHQQIVSLFRTSEPSYGAETSKELLAGGTVRTWNHFHGTVATKHRSTTPDKDKGDYNTTTVVFKRGLLELRVSAFEDVIDLITENNLYRGAEFLPALKAFQKLQGHFNTTPCEVLTNYVWANASNPASRFRNTAIGTLITDLSDGMPLEQAVKSFEAKVAPTNYKRPTALISQSMVKSAMVTIDSLGLQPALERRFATIHDITINNVLWADGSVKPMMKGGIEGLLLDAAVARPNSPAGDAIGITIADFMSSVLPTATSMDMLVKNTQQGNFMSLTAPVHAEVEPLFKWDNNFAWSYDGNITDSDLRRQVQGAGGRVDGVLRFSHTWNYDARNASLMDLHVFMPGSSSHADGCNDRYPNGQRVGWNMRKDNLSGGIQDVDYTAEAPEGYVPVENITFPEMNRLKQGEYVFKIHNWQLRNPTKGGFRAEIEFGGKVFQYDHPAPLKNKEWITLAVATLKDGVFTIEHKHAVGVASQEKWGVKTEQMVKVNTVMFSPNYWDDNAVGNKHWFFILEGCKTDLPARGIYNEFLNSKLKEHRKVFEILGDKTKCQPTEEQLSGVGFSSTKRESVIVQVTSGYARKTFNIQF